MHGVERQQQAGFTAGLYSRPQLENCKWEKRERGRKLSASRVAETGKWHQREQTGGHYWKKKVFERQYLWPQYQSETLCLERPVIRSL